MTETVRPNNNQPTLKIDQCYRKGGHIYRRKEREMKRRGAKGEGEEEGGVKDEFGELEKEGRQE